MAIEYHLEVKDIKGESGAQKHKDHIELMSWSWGATNPTSISGSGMSAGKVSMSDLTFTKQVDKSSPNLLKLCVKGDHVDTATLYCSKQTGQKNPEDFLTIELKEVYISSFQIGGSSGEDVGSESVSITYGQIKYGYKVQQKDGSLVDGGTVSYDLIARAEG